MVAEKGVEWRATARPGADGPRLSCRLRVHAALPAGQTLQLSLSHSQPPIRDALSATANCPLHSYVAWRAHGDPVEISRRHVEIT